MWSNIALFLMGISFGIVTSGGVFALITTTGVITRIADYSRSASKVRTYENMIIFGGIFGNIIYVFNLQWGKAVSGIVGIIILTAYGLFAGMFVGCLATSLAETLKVTAVFTRRMKITGGLGFIVLSLALGKMAGSLLQFYLGWAKMT